MKWDPMTKVMICAGEASGALLGRAGSLAELNADLCARLRSGEMDAATPGLLAALRANITEQIAIDQPSYAPEPAER